MTVFLLIRHAEVDQLGKSLSGRLPDVHLNAQGRESAEAVAAALRSISLKAVYSSPLERAMETAEPTARMAGKQIIPDPRLQEVDFGKLTGKTFSELRDLPIWQEVHIRPEKVRYPGGESLQDVQNRAVEMIREVQSGCDTGIVALFTHADTIRLALAHFLQMPLPAYHALMAAPASISVLSLSHTMTRVIGINLPPGSPLRLKAE